MFLKLCKMELKYSYRGFLFSFLLMFLSSLFLRVNGNTDNLMQMLAAFIYVGAMFALIIMVFINIFRNYHKTMFTKEAYLTHTLPVSMKALLNSKMLIAAFWCIVSSLAILLSLFIVMMLSGEVSLNDISQLIGLFFKELGKIPGVFIWNIVYGIISFFEFILTVYFIMNLIHTRFVPKFQVFIGVVLFFLIDYVKTYISSIVLIQLLSLSRFDNTYVILSLIFSLVLCSLYYIGNIYLLNHKVEIE